MVQTYFILDYTRAKVETNIFKWELRLSGIYVILQWQDDNED
jgi:hypothetical protein